MFNKSTKERKMKKTIQFGKVDYMNNGKKNCLIEVELNFDGVRFSASGTIWNHLKTDSYSGGQNLDTIKKFLPNNKLFNKIYDIWKKYHLNDMTAGSPKQEEYLKSIISEDSLDYSYDLKCEKLKEVNLLHDKSYLYDGKPYQYGTAWLTTEIPTEVKQEINNLIN
jgi:hypothetical protein|tara:strand:+ start:17 stop:514 length:498 start_codon:yes stop_codon:yes gene_type:complete